MFYDTLKAVCEEKNTSPSAVALAIGMSKSNVTEWKNGRSPKVSTVIKIAKHLSVDIESLIPED